MPNFKREKVIMAGKNPPTNLYPTTSSPKDIDIEDSINVTAKMRTQSHKMKGGNLEENCLNCQLPQLNPRTYLNDDPVPQLPAAHTQLASEACIAGKAATLKKTLGITRVQKAVQEAWKQAQKKAIRRNSMWS